MLSLSTWYLLRNIFVKVFKADKYISHSIIMCMLFVTVQCMVGRVEAFYWYAGAANYMLIHSLSLFFFGVLIAAVYDRGKRRIADLVLCKYSWLSGRWGKSDDRVKCNGNYAGCYWIWSGLKEMERV